MKKKAHSRHHESQRSAKVNGKKAATAKTPKGSQKKGGAGKQTEALRSQGSARNAGYFHLHLLFLRFPPAFRSPVSGLHRLVSPD